MNPEYLEDETEFEEDMSPDRDHETREESTLDEVEWLGLAREAFESSRQWMNENLRQQWSRNLAHFRSKHPSGSKYHSDSYKRRSSLFRPKTRSAVRRNEAHAAAAFFQSAELVSLEPKDDNDPMQLASAEVFKAILGHRLDKDIPWFQTVIGAFQDAMVHGVCVSKQTWEYLEEMREVETPRTDPITGQVIVDLEGRPVIQLESVPHLVRDRPKIELLPPENLRLDPGADWKNPIESSPYVIHIIPMRLDEIKGRMEKGWHSLDEDRILQAARETEESTSGVAQDREGRRASSQGPKLKGYTVIHVHENFMRKEGRDWVFFTLGAVAMLTDPIPVDRVYPHGRPFVMGACLIEAHRLYPSSLVELSQDLQSALNEVQNQRFDNVQLVLNKRYFARRGSGVDLRSLTRNIPGSVTMMANPESDVIVHQTPDITSSSYQEQEMLNADFDAAIGTFDQGSVNVNRRLNETVGGMNILSADANLSTEYLLRVFVETWAEPVLRQLLKLEQNFETDQVILAMAGRKSPLVQRFGLAATMDMLLEQELTLRVQVGLGATNSQTRLERFLLGAQTVAQLIGTPPDAKQLINEVFGLLGYKDGARFYPNLGQPPQEKPQAEEHPLVQVERDKLALKDRELRQKAAIEGARLATHRQEKLRSDQLKKTEIISKDNIERLRVAAALATEHKRERLEQIRLGFRP